MKKQMSNKGSQKEQASVHLVLIQVSVYLVLIIIFLIGIYSMLTNAYEVPSTWALTIVVLLPVLGLVGFSISWKVMIASSKGYKKNSPE